MSSLVALRQAVITDVKAAVTDAKTVEPYGGALNLEEVGRMSKRSPAVFIAVVAGGGSLTAPGGEIRLIAKFAAFVLVADGREMERDALALSVTEQVLACVGAWRWKGTASASQPDKITLQSLFSGKLARNGITLMGASWEQTLPIGEDRFRAEHAALEWPDHLDPDGLSVAGAAHGVADPESGHG